MSVHHRCITWASRGTVLRHCQGTEDRRVEQFTPFRALIRLNLLIASDDDRVALRAVKEVLDRTLGRPRERQPYRDSIGPRRDVETESAQVREKLSMLIERRAQAIAESRIAESALGG